MLADLQATMPRKHTGKTHQEVGKMACSVFLSLPQAGRRAPRRYWPHVSILTWRPSVPTRCVNEGPAPAQCGGFAGILCPEDKTCYDDAEM